MSTGNYADINGISMYYELHGTGMPLVLIHGGGSTIQTTFGILLPVLANKYKVIAVELQAHGHSSDRDAPETFEQDADDVAALLAHLGIKKATLLGFSNGGNTAMQVAIRHPQVVRKLIVVSSFYQRAGMIPGFFQGMQNARLENMPQPLKDAFLEIIPDTARLRIMHDKDKARMLAFEDWSDHDLQSIQCPALLMVADKDVVLAEHAVKMSRLIPHAQLVILPGIHGSFLGEICTAVPGSNMPAITASLIESFLDK